MSSQLDSPALVTLFPRERGGREEDKDIVACIISQMRGDQRPAKAFGNGIEQKADHTKI